jgi:hypothetical protein
MKTGHFDAIADCGPEKLASRVLNYPITFAVATGNQVSKKRNYCNPPVDWLTPQ